MSNIEITPVLEAILPENASKEKRKLLENILKKPILTNGDLTTLFQIGERTLFNWREIYKLSFIRLSGRYYYKQADIIAFIESKYNNSGHGNHTL